MDNDDVDMMRLYRLKECGHCWSECNFAGIVFLKYARNMRYPLAGKSYLCFEGIASLCNVAKPCFNLSRKTVAIFSLLVGTDTTEHDRRFCGSHVVYSCRG